MQPVPKKKRQHEDLIYFEPLSVDGITKFIHKRVRKGQFYMFFDTSLLSVNPLKPLPTLYDLAEAHRYSVSRFDTSPAHVFTIAENAYHAMRQFNKDQVIVFRGLSGSGKTQNANLVLHFLLSMSVKHHHMLKEALIVEANVILEAFGHAQTVMNPNSSRYEKMIELHYDKSGHICGGKYTAYMLDKSRVTNQPAHESNFHIFYQLVYGASDLEAKLYSLRTQFRLLNNSDEVSAEARAKFAEQFARVKTAFLLLGFNEEKQNEIFKVLAGILHLGNVQFKHTEASSAAIVDEVPMNLAANLLGFSDAVELTRTLTLRAVPVSETSHISYTSTAAQALEKRDLLARHLYGRLWECVIRLANDRVSDLKPNERAHTIALLDFAGFGTQAENSFEQVLYNYTAEKVEQQVLDSLFKDDVDFYERESVLVDRAVAPSHQKHVEVYEDGLFPVLEEYCRDPSKGPSLPIRITDALRSNALYEPLPNENCFRVAHLMGKVEYSSAGFYNSVKDWSETFGPLIEQSTVPLLKEKTNVQRGVVASPRRDRSPSLINQYTGCVAELINVLRVSRPHQVLCLHQNAIQTPDHLDDALLHLQMQFFSVLETAKMRLAAYPVHIPLKEFAKRYHLMSNLTRLGHRTPSGVPNLRAICEAVFRIKDKGKSMWSIGRNFVCLKQLQFLSLEKRRVNATVQRVVLIQSWWRMLTERDRFLIAKNAAICLQTAVRRHQAQKKFSALLNATVTLQCLLRSVCARRLCEPRLLAITQSRVPAKEEKKHKKKRDKEERRQRRLSNNTPAPVQGSKIIRLASENAESRPQGALRFHIEESTTTLPRSVQHGEVLAAASASPSLSAGGSSPSVSSHLASATSPAQPVASHSSLASLSHSALLVKDPNPAAAELRRSRTSTAALVFDKKATSSLLSSRHTVRSFNKAVPTPSQQPTWKQKMIVKVEDVSKYPLVDFANKWFQHPKRTGSIFGKRVADVTERITFSPRLMSSPLLPVSNELTKSAMDSFARVLDYMYDRDATNAALALLDKGLRNEELRDEIFCLVVKQTNQNPYRDLCARMWELLSFCIATFKPSRTFVKYLHCYIFGATHPSSAFASSPLYNTSSSVPANLPNEIATAATYCLQLLQHAHANDMQRKLIPSLRELTALKKFERFYIQIEFPGGALHECEMDSATTSAEVIEMIARKLNCELPFEYSLYEIVNGTERSLAASDIIADTLAKEGTVKLILRKKLFLYPRELNCDDFEAFILFHQVSEDIANEVMICGEEDMLRLCAIKLHSKICGRPIEKLRFDLRKMIPFSMLRTRTPEAWKQLITQKYQQLMDDLDLAAKNSRETEKLFLEEAIKIPFYGSTFFPCEIEVASRQTQAQQNSLSSPPPHGGSSPSVSIASVSSASSTAVAAANPFNLPAKFWVVINVNGVAFVDQETKEPLHSFRFAEVSAVPLPTHRSLKFFFGDPEKQTSFEILTPKAAEITHLMKDYYYWLKELAQYAIATSDFELPSGVASPNSPSSNSSAPAATSSSANVSVQIAAASLSFKKGDLVTILEKDDKSGWYVGECNGKRGSFPVDKVEILFSNADVELVQKNLDAARKQRLNLPSAGGTLSFSQLSRRGSRRSISTIAKESVRAGGSSATANSLAVTSGLVAAGAISASPASSRSNAMPGYLPHSAAMMNPNSSNSNNSTNSPGLEIYESYRVATAAKKGQLRPDIRPDGTRARSNSTSNKSGKVVLEHYQTAAYQFRVYAQRNFRQFKSGRPVDPSTLEAAISFSAVPISKSLLKLTERSMNRAAAAIFLDVMKYMQDYPAGPVNPYKLLSDIIAPAVNMPQLADEIYCQLIKQTTNNPKTSSRIKGWEILACCTVAFMPSEALLPYVTSYCVMHSKVSHGGTPIPIIELANVCVGHLTSVGAGSSALVKRVTPPSAEELEAILVGGQLQCVVRLPGTATKIISIDGRTRVEDVISELCRLTRLPKYGWGLFHVKINQDFYGERLLKPRENICDVINSFKISGSRKGMNSSLLYRKFLFLDEDFMHQNIEKPIYTLLYHQAVEDVVKGRLAVDEADACQLAALMCQIQYRDFDQAECSHPSFEDRLKTFIPGYYLQQQPMSFWMMKVLDMYRAMSGVSVSEARKRYMEKVIAMPLYGSMQFPVQYILEKGIWSRFTMAINKIGVHLLSGYSSKPVRTWRYEEIVHHSCVNESGAFYFAILVGTLMNPIREVFEGESAPLITEIFSVYRNAALKHRNLNAAAVAQKK